MDISYTINALSSKALMEIDEVFGKELSMRYRPYVCHVKLFDVVVLDAAVTFRCYVCHVIPSVQVHVDTSS